MKGMIGGAVLMAAVMAFAPIQVEAQRGARGQRGMMGRSAQPGVEQIMRLRERLELSESQLGQLDAIRSEVVQHRASQQAEMAELRSQVMAGQIEAAAARDQFEGRREAGEAFADDLRSRVESVLTDAQKETIQEAAGRARAFERGRASVQRGGQRGYRSGRGAQRGRSRQRATGHRGDFQRMRGAAQGRMMRGPGGGFGPPPPPVG